MSQDNAKAIYQAHLDTVSQALWDLDMPTLLRLLLLPATIGTRNGHIQLTTEGQMREMILSTRKSLEALGATAYLRHAEHAAFSNAERTELRGRHISYALSGGSFAMTPFSSWQTLVLQDGAWCSTGIEADLEERHLRLLVPGLLRAPNTAQPQSCAAQARPAPAPKT
ncbi:MAG: hypothetical protein N4A53_06690 [Pelagimonas sp.]|jgi:hypothetical protein|nr:hypothetical protein [Pelagimonas sp.]